MAEREDDGEQLLRSLVEFSVGLEIEIDIDKVSTGKELTRCWSKSSAHGRVFTYLENHAR